MKRPVFPWRRRMKRMSKWQRHQRNMRGVIYRRVGAILERERLAEERTLRGARTHFKKIMGSPEVRGFIDVVLRDQFAAYAIACAAWGEPLNSLDPKERKDKIDKITEIAYRIADSMMKKRKR